MSKLIVIGGPTASGKTSLAIKVAKLLSTEILSADSRQFYREMEIGNARPNPDELAQVKHHFVADRSVLAPLSAGAFAREALTLLEELFRTREQVVIVGGSGLYLDAVTEGLNEFPRVDVNTKAKVERLLKHEGLEGLQKAVELADPDYYATVDRQNPRRLQRALEVSWAAGKPYSSFLRPKAERSFTSHFFQPDLSTLPRENYIAPKTQSRNTPDPDRLNLYARIERRLDQMMDHGLLDEVVALYEYRELPALQTVGYQEFFPYLEGSTSLEYALELAKRNSRRYAKRQSTWFGRDDKYRPAADASDIIEQLK
ncbi:tRNA (adenosine(37)-N6)-dimethylallyltransferase MiaA [Lewinellaceae bacterium SD302]|nr:tRNA (adenosine(37)-N6)-dimethylallyltransferase MiaA [Lewinellaceae bacterium SD302]